MARRGPKTQEGKAVVRLNAVRHGVLSTTPVIPHLENDEDWERHRSGVVYSLDPQGYVEEELAERIASLLWRLRRVVRFEQESITKERKVAETRPFAYEKSPLLPSEQTLEKVIRYEAHLHRQFVQTLHELEALQKRRLGEQAPLARLDVQT